jgi:phosphatidylinositol alpha-1,6-mannosyltransferase
MTTIKRVALVTQTFPPKMGGMEAVMTSLAKHFAETGSQVAVFPNKPAPEEKFYNSYLLPSPKLIRHFLKKLLINLKANPQDLVICDSWKSVKAVPAKFKNIVVLAHGQEYLNTSKRKIEIETALIRAKAIVCSSHATMKLVEGFTPIHRDKSYVVYPTYMLEEPSSIQLKESAVDTLKLLSISRLEKRKGIQNAMKAIAKLQHEGLIFEWDICGKGPAEKELHDLSKELKLEKNIRFPGRVSDKDKQLLLSQADLFVMPSYQEGNSLEGFGISYVEAAAFGVPSVGGQAGGANEAVNAPECGWCCDGASVDEIYNALKESCFNKRERSLRGSRALIRFNKEMRGKTVFNKLFEICRVIK